MNSVDETTSHQGERHKYCKTTHSISTHLISSQTLSSIPIDSNIYQKKNPQHNHPQQPPTTINMSAQDIPTGEVQDNDYKSRTGQNEIPVQADDKPVEDPIDPETADSDAQLGPLQSSSSIQNIQAFRLTILTEADDKNAIDQSNILNERTRGAAKSAGTYQEPGDEEGLPGPDDGTSRVAGGVH